jgi:Ca2+-binding EF-hand superfamily protein
VDEVFEVFASVADAHGEIGREEFGDCVAAIIQGTTNVGPGASERVADELFEIFDADGNGVVDFAELASGLSVLCGGSRDDKVRAAFELFDTNGDGVISRAEMVTYLKSVFKLIYATKPELHGSVGVGPDELGVVTADQCFAEADLNGDGALSFAEFQRWYEQGGGGAALSSMQEVVSEELTLEVVRDATGLHECDVNRVVALFSRASDRDGLLSEAAFGRCFRRIVAALDDDGSKLGQLNAVLGKLFQLFDRDRSGLVDSVELISGLTVMHA